MQKLVILGAFLAVAVADVSHLFRQPNYRAQPHQQKYGFPVPPSVHQTAPRVAPRVTPQQHAYHQKQTGSQVPILKQNQEFQGDGNYNFGFETQNGITVQEQGSVRAVGPLDVAKTVQGSYHYTAPDGTPVVVNYVADENGFHAEGAHLPTSPPIPEAIVRSLAYNAAHPVQAEQQRKHRY